MSQDYHAALVMTKKRVFLKTLQLKLQGSILEPLIALMIILFALTASITVVMQANQRNNMQQLMRAGVCADRILNRTLAERRLLSEDIIENGLNIEKEITWYKKEDQLLLIRILVHDNRGRLLVRRQKIIIADETTPEE